MNIKSKSNNLIQSNLIVDFFESNDEHIICYYFKKTEDTSDGYTLEHITMDEFEAWLTENDYLEGSTEQCIGSNHDGDPIYKNIDWSFSMKEFMKAEYHNWPISDLLTDYITHKNNK